MDRDGCPHTYPAQKVILATGYYDRPNLLNVPGEDLPKVIHYYKEPHPYYDHDVMVVGAKNSAAIAALELFWTGRGSPWSIAAKASHKSVKYWIKPNIENRIKSGEVKGYFRTASKRSPGFRGPLDTRRRIELKNDFVFAMIGYHPDLDFLAAHGSVST